MSLKNDIARVLARYFQKDSRVIEKAIIETLSVRNGDFTVQCFKLTKILNERPDRIAYTIKMILDEIDYLEEVNIIQAYVNIYVAKNKITEELIDRFINPRNIVDNRVICIDSPQINSSEYIGIENIYTEVYIKALYGLFEEKYCKVVKVDLENRENFRNEILDRLHRRNLISEFNGSRLINMKEINCAPIIVEKNKRYYIDNIARILHAKKVYDFHEYICIKAYSDGEQLKKELKILEMCEYDWVKRCKLIVKPLLKSDKECHYDNEKKEWDIYKFKRVILNRVLISIKEKKYLNYNIEELAEVISEKCFKISFLKCSNKNNIVWKSYDDILEDIQIYIDIFSTYYQIEEILNEVNLYNGGSVDEDVIFEEYFLVKKIDKLDEYIDLAIDTKSPEVILEYIIEVMKVYWGLEEYFFKYIDCDEKIIIKKIKILKTINKSVEKISRIIGIRC